jgi:hypothetical protein
LLRDVIAQPDAKLLAFEQKEKSRLSAGPPCRTPYDVTRELAALARVLLAWIRLTRIWLTWVLPLLAGLLLPAALLLLAGLLSRVLVRLARIRILVAHSEFSLFRPQ